MKHKYLFILFFLISIVSFSQVGINNTNPHPSSILDIESTSQGVLTPRMTTLQRTGISAPANGLLVYDTDQGAFYYFENSIWNKLQSEIRDNYKLIKTVADLAPELALGGGSEYLLDTNTLYEINGTITLAAPINLNGAYISGLDANEDVLVRVGGTIFAGSSGGSIRNLTLTAPGGSIFGLSGTGTETLVFQNCIVANSASIGAISTFGLVFSSIIQFVNNATGITYTDIGSLLLTNVAWFGNNSGTYETYVGTFGLIEKGSGFSAVPVGAVGINVSANPTVASGNIISTAFSGAGTYVVGYTSGTYPGYYFNTSWEINCPGLPIESDWVATGNFYYDGLLTTGFSQTISNGTAVAVQGGGTFTSNSLFRFSSVGGNRLVYDGNKEREFNVNASLSIRVNSAPLNFYAFLFAKNGVVITESNALAYISSDAQIQNISLTANIDLETGDYIGIFSNS